MFLLSFPNWESTDDPFYYNLFKNKHKKLAKKKVKFEQTLTTQSSSILARKKQSGLRYRIRYQVTRSNNSPEDDDNNNDDNDNNQENNLSLNH